MAKGLRKRTPYQQPPSPFQPGDWVKFEGKRYEVIASTHTHSQLQGVRYAIANWELKRVRISVDREKIHDTLRINNMV